MRALAEAIANVTLTVIATRGQRLALTRICSSSSDPRNGEFDVEMLAIAEINADNCLTAHVLFDVDDIDAAFEELDARYLAGEAAAHAHTWSLIARAFAGLNRREIPATTPAFVDVDHRALAAFEPGELRGYIRAGWELAPDVSIHIECVHRLSQFGAVVTDAAKGTSQAGFEAEWREIAIVTVEGELLSRCEIFDEADIDAALARFDELTPRTPRLENAASQVCEHLWTCLAARDWDALADTMADDISMDDRRRVVNAGVLHGRDVQIANMHAIAEVGLENITSAVMATRGERLALTRTCSSIRGQPPEEVATEMLSVVEIDADNRIASSVVFDLDDIDAAFAELDARYVAGEAAAHSHMWSVIVRAYVALNRHEMPATTPDYIIVDHQLHNESRGLTEYLQASWDLTPELRMYIEAVHRLSDDAGVVTLVLHGTSQEGFDAEWRIVEVLTREGDAGKRCEIFDERDVDAALARFEELSRPTPRLENAASQLDDRFAAYFAARDWDAMAEIVADDISVDDRRRVVSAGIRVGRDAEIANVRIFADVGGTNLTATVMATRGERLVLSRLRLSGRDQRPEAFNTEALTVVEIDADNRMAARVVFDLDNIDTAFEELDARYLAGEAAAYAHTWSVIAGSYAALNRHEHPATTPDWVNIDHRRGTSFAPGDMTANMRALWDQTPDFSIHIEAVHRLSNRGAVVTHAATGTSQEGFDAEWQAIDIITVEGDLINRSELFEEADLDTALARFEELHPQTPRLENAASRVCERYRACFAARDWDALAKVVADAFSIDDRRPVVNAGIRHGRDAEIEDIRAAADVGFTNLTFTIVATRGEHLMFSRIRMSGPDQSPGAFHAEALQIIEIDADERLASVVVFELHDFDAALEELDTRFLAGEAAAHSHTWSVIAGSSAAFNRHELPAITPDSVNIDHRRGIAFAPGDLIPYIRATWDVAPKTRHYIEAVHRLTNLGAVFIQVVKGTSPEGFDAEWREIAIVTVEGNLMSHVEMFDEADIDTALARFDELDRPAPRLENEASRVDDRFDACFAARDWDAMAKILTDDTSVDDRRRVVNAGIRRGRDVEVASMRAVAGLGVTNATTVAIATRGQHLALSRTRFSGRDQGPEAFHTEILGVVEIDADERIVARVAFDPDDIDAAFAELDARYLAGEATPYSHAWSVIASGYAALNRHEVPPTTPDWVNIDHRRGIAFAPGDMISYIRATWDVAPDVDIHVGAVHRLSNRGAVVTHTAYGTSQDGFDAEWREIALLMVGGDAVNHCEMFDEADIDAAIARFEELHPQARLENAASRVTERFLAYFAARDWEAMAELMAEDVFASDRRRVVSAGVRHGRDAEIENMRAWADVGVRNILADVIATRGESLVLGRVGISGPAQGPEASQIEVLGLIELNADERIVARLAFDLDDIDAAFAELDARYLAGDAAAHAHTWSVVARAFAAVNRHELPELTPDWVNVDHRRAASFAPGDMAAYTRATWEQLPDVMVSVEAVHRLTNLGAVLTQAASGTSQEGFHAEWHEVAIYTVEGDRLNRCELFDETDIDAALARFDELNPPTRRLENAATRMDERLKACFAARDWAATQEILAEDTSNDDRRRVVGAGVLHGREVNIADLQAIADVGTKIVTSTVIATRRERLALSRYRFSGRDPRPEGFHAEMLGVVEINADNRIAARVWFDLGDIDAAFAELDARYLAGEAAAHAHTWSVIEGVYSSFNRRELPATTPDLVTIDHRPLITIEARDMAAFIRDVMDQMGNVRIYMEAVHRLTDFGAVVSHAAHGVSQQGFDAEWRMTFIYTVEDDLISRYELFDEADIDAALARFEELSRPEPRLENSASQVYQRFWGYYAARDWAGMTEMLADDISTDDRRRVVNAGIQYGRDAQVADMQGLAEIGANMTWTVMATRGQRLILSRLSSFNRDLQHGEFDAEMLSLVEIAADNRIAAGVVFDVDDIDGAFAELDARYLAGEAAPYSQTWSLVTNAYAAASRHELPPRTPDWVTVDHRRGRAFAPGDEEAYLRATWNLLELDANIYIEEVHRLSNLGAVVTHVAGGTSHEGFDAEWREISVSTVYGELMSRAEIFDEADIDAALARFDELQPHAPRLENAATQMADRFWTHFSAHDSDALAGIMADDYCSDDRRRVVGAGVRRGRDGAISNMRTIADLGFTNAVTTVIAIRGHRLCLIRSVYSGGGQETGTVVTDVLGVVEVNTDDLGAAVVVFDVDDIDAAFAELDARYLAGEAAAHSQMWSLIAGVYAAFNRHELPPTSDWVTIDHRVRATFEGEDLAAYLRTGWDVAPNKKMCIEAVHRLTDLGAVVTHTAYGTSQDGFEAEWRMILLTVESGSANRSELFDETDLDAALARFDELSRPTPRLENAASQVYERCNAYFVARDWDAMSKIFADNAFTDDRRRVVRAGVRQGRDAVVEMARTLVELSMSNVTSTVIATRGERLILARAHYSGHDRGPGEFPTDIISVVEIDADNRIAAHVVFDDDDMDAAFAELDARYVAGEAADHTRTWALVVEGYAALRRQQHPATTPDWVNIDHRRAVAFAPGELTAYIDATWDITPQFSIYPVAMHRLSDLGAVVTHAAYGSSQEGFDAEWLGVHLVMFEGDLCSRSELFGADLDTALARFDELNRPALLENAATGARARLADAFNRRHVDGFLALLADNGRYEDRRKGLRDEGPMRRKEVSAIFEAPKTWRAETEPLAIRGSRLGLSRCRYRDTRDSSRPITAEHFELTEVGDDDMVERTVLFDLDDIDAAFAELEARYLAGEAAADADTWSVIAGSVAAINRHELPEFTPDFVNIDHRRAVAFAPGEMTAYIRATLDDAPDVRIYIEVVHRLTKLGAVCTHAARNTSQQGFEAEWREIYISTVEGDLPNRCELFDETDLDAALARFDELNRAPLLENAATRTRVRLADAFNRRDVDGLLALVSADGRYEDRRKGLRDEGPWRGKFAQTLFEAPKAWRSEIEPVAVRGSRLGLTRDSMRDTNYSDRTITAEHLTLTEIDDDGLLRDIVLFDVADINGAMGELTARWIASGEVAHPAVVEAAHRLIEASNCYDWDAIARRCAGATYINHRLLGTPDTGADYISSIQMLAQLVPDLWIEQAEILSHSAAGFATVLVIRGTSTEGVAIELPFIMLSLVESDHVKHIETFDPDQRDLALARFEELNRSG
jgi:hypothetical protein